MMIDSKQRNDVVRMVIVAAAPLDLKALIHGCKIPRSHHESCVGLKLSGLHFQISKSSERAKNHQHFTHSSNRKS